MMPENKKSRKPRKIKAFGVVCGVPARIRTGGVPLRRRTLYPAEVQRHLAICGYFYSTHLPPFCERREVEQTLRRRSLYPAELRKHIPGAPKKFPPHPAAVSPQKLAVNIRNTQSIPCIPSFRCRISQQDCPMRIYFEYGEVPCRTVRFSPAGFEETTLQRESQSRREGKILLRRRQEQCRTRG